MTKWIVEVFGTFVLSRIGIPSCPSEKDLKLNCLSWQWMGHFNSHGLTWPQTLTQQVRGRTIKESTETVRKSVDGERGQQREGGFCFEPRVMFSAVGLDHEMFLPSQSHEEKCHNHTKLHTLTQPGGSSWPLCKSHITPWSATSIGVCTWKCQFINRSTHNPAGQLR